MAVTLATESWNGTTGAAWPAQWVVTIPSGYTESATIQANTGQMSITTGYGGLNAVLPNMMPVVNTEVLVTITKPTNASHVGIWMCASGGVNLSNQGAPFPYNGYILELYGNADSFYGIDVVNYINGETAAENYDVQSYTPLSGYTDTVTVRFNRTGNTISYKLWVTSGTEPSTWTQSLIDPSSFSIGAGVVGLSFSNDFTTAPSTTFDSFSVTTDIIGTTSWIHI